MNRKSEALDLTAVATTVALAMALLVAIGAGSFRLLDLASALAISAPAVLAGRVLGVILKLPRRPGFIFAFEIVVGYAALSLLDLGWAVCFRLNAIQALISSAATVVVLFAWIGRLPANGTGRSAQPRWSDLAILPIITGLVAIWDHTTLSCLRDAEKSGVFLGWPDLMIHATQINYLLNYKVFVGQSLELAGTPQYFYHRGSYSLAAAFAALSGRETLQVATCFWQPIGLIFLGLGGYGYASALGTRATGLIAMVALFLVPDAAMYGLRNGYFSFHWLVVVSPASGYGIALVFFALAAFKLGLSARRFDLVFIGAILCLATFGFKVQVAIPAMMLYVALSLISWRPGNPLRRVFALVIIGGAIMGAVVISEHVKLAPHFLSGTYDALSFFVLAHTQKSRYSEYYLKWIAGSGPVIKALEGVGLLLAAALGALLPASIVVAGYRIRRGMDWRIEIIPFGMLAAYLATIFLLPVTAYGNYTEYSHRPFVLVYAVMLVATVVGLSGKGEEIATRWPALKLRMLLGALCLTLGGLEFAWSEGQNIQLSWGNPAGLPMSRGMLAACGYIRAHSQIGDRVLASDGDPMVMVAALSERPSFLSRGQFFRKFNGSTGDVADVRGQLLADMRLVKGYQELRGLGKAHQIRWFLLWPRDLPSSDSKLAEMSVWSADGIQVFDLHKDGIAADALHATPNYLLCAK
jgi:hypothetical protein